MKKILAVLFGLFMMSGLSARIMMQADGLFLTNDVIYDYDCFAAVPESFNYEFNFYNGMQVSLGYEFFTDRLDDDFHFFTGVDVGGLVGYFSYGGFAGFDYHLFDYENFRFELMTTVNLGQLTRIKGPYFYYVQTSVDFVAMPANRRFPYVGIGLSNVDTTLYNKYVDYGYELFIKNTLAVHLVAGVRL